MLRHNEMLRRHEAELDATYDFRALVVPLGAGQTLMRPPIVTEAQMAFALGEPGPMSSAKWANSDAT